MRESGQGSLVRHQRAPKRADVASQPNEMVDLPPRVRRRITHRVDGVGLEPILDRLEGANVLVKDPFEQRRQKNRSVENPNVAGSFGERREVLENGDAFAMRGQDPVVADETVDRARARSSLTAGRCRHEKRQMQIAAKSPKKAAGGKDSSLCAVSRER